ncbi:MAG: TIGR01177 family methyltransferase, partial [Candidatus Nanohaloarchaea archaeon]|nr:TIGR01177 family methyltransferase [Candidatus Nanohaloarchaea archaeon]
PLHPPMNYAVLLSGEHPELPLAELEASLRADGIEFEIEKKEGNLVFLEGEELEEVADRLALSFEVSEVLHT